MKSILIIGLGRFGQHLCLNLASLGNEIMIVDEREECLVGVRNFDICFVCIGTNFQSSLEITSLVKELGAKRVISKANRDIHAKFLLRNGADEVIYPDRDLAERLAIKYSANHIFDYIELTEEFSIYEIPPVPSWIGKSLKQIDVRAKFNISVIGIKNGEEVSFLPSPEHEFTKDEHIMIIGRKKDVDAILKKF